MKGDYSDGSRAPNATSTTSLAERNAYASSSLSADASPHEDKQPAVNQTPASNTDMTPKEPVENEITEVPIHPPDSEYPSSREPKQAPSEQLSSGNGTASPSPPLPPPPPPAPPSSPPSTPPPSPPPCPPPAQPPADPESHVNNSTYRDIILRAAEVFDHLKNGRILNQVIHEGTNVKYIDYTDTSVSAPVHIDDSNDIVNLVDNIPAGISQRLFMVEDLSWNTIECLGTHLGISPEFFEEHLLNSGYGKAQYDDEPSSSWVTSGMKKSHVSLKWYRPAWRLATAPFSKLDLEDLLNHEVGRLEYTLGKSGHVSVCETESNIFRSEWELWTDPRTTSRVKRLCGWEERASIWSKTTANGCCRIVVLLVDPLPTVRESRERLVRPNPETAIGVGIRVRVPEPETVSIYSAEENEPDPRVGMDDLEEQAPRRVTKRNSRRRRTVIERFIRGFASRRKQAEEKAAERVVERMESKLIIEQTAPRVPVEVDLDTAFQLEESLDLLKEQLYETRSTMDSFWQHLNSPNYNSDYFGVSTPLFEIVRRDVLEFLKLLSKVLEGINVDILDDATMETRLSIWRLLIMRAQLELPELRQSVVRFFLFPKMLDTLGTQAGTATGTLVDESEGDGAPRELDDLCNEIDDTLRRFNAVSSSLTSNMALLDSRRSIAEAQSVTKLTELAFFYIPLTFAATLFGMQIEEFENRAPLSVFIGLGIAFTALSYLVRLVLRSTWLRRVLHGTTESIKLYADQKRQPMQRGYIPTSLFVEWLFHKLRFWFTRTSRISRTAAITLVGILGRGVLFLMRPFKFILSTVLFIAFICMVPLAVLWAKHMEFGIQVPVTLSLLATVSVIVFIANWKATSPEDRAALPRLIKAELVLAKSGKSRFFSFLKWVGAMVALVLPIVVLWTKPVSTGTKAALTIAIVLIVALTLTTYVNFRMVSANILGVNNLDDVTSFALDEGEEDD